MSESNYNRRLTALNSSREVAFMLWHFRNTEKAAMELWAAEACYRIRLQRLRSRYTGAALPDSG